MYVHHEGVVTLTAGLLSALAGRRREGAGPSTLGADLPVTWIGAPPTDEDAQVAWDVCRRSGLAGYGAVIEQLADRLFRRDLARLGGAVDVGFLGSLYRTYAREVIHRLEGTHVGIGKGAS